MSRPCWSLAPEWGEWQVQDRDGDWMWFENEPFLSDEFFEWVDFYEGLCEYHVQERAPDWKESKEQRPL